MPAKIGSIQAAQEVLDKGFYGVPERRRIDAVSAGLVVSVGAALDDKNRAHLDALPVHRAATLCWKLVNK